MLDGIISFFQVLPRILAILDRLGSIFQDHEVLEWMTNLETSIDQLEAAKDSDGKAKAALNLVSAIRSLK